MEAEALRLNLELERFPAFLGTNIPEKFQPYFVNVGGKLSRGEIGCYASHLALCAKLEADNDHDAYLILEDDIILDDDIHYLMNAISTMDFHWDRIHVAGHAKYSMLEIFKIRRFSVVRYSRIPTNGAGYIITKEGARKFLKIRKIRRALDHDFQRDWQYKITTLGIFPKPITQRGEMISSIDLEEPRQRTFVHKLFIDTPFDILRSFIHSITLLGIENYILLQWLNIKIDFIKSVYKKKIIFMKENKNISEISR